MKIKNNLLFKIFLSSIFLAMFPMLVFSYIFGNGSGSGFQTGEENLSGAANEIEALVIRGAGEYLQAYAATLMFLNQLEIQSLQGIDYANCRDILTGSTAHLDQAMETYRLLIQRAETTPYNAAVLLRLRDFDYKGIMERNGFDGVIIEKVKGQLMRGDITGFYKMIYTRMNRAKALLQEINTDVCQNKMPPVITLWQLNRMYSNTLMAGQFVAIVFGTIN
jgi:hypothetical protein